MSEPETSPRKRRYNAFGKYGSIVEDPRYVVSLAEHPEERFGMASPKGVTVEEVAEWLYMAVKGVSYGDVRKRTQADQPVIVLEYDGEREERTAWEGL